MIAVTPAMRTLLRVAVSIVLFGVLFALIPAGQIVSALSSADSSLICLGLLLALAARLFAAERTWVISRAVKLPLTRWQTIEALFISNFWSLLLPGMSAGTVTTVYRYRSFGCSLVASVGVLGASRIVELVMFVSIAAAAIFLHSGMDGIGESSGPLVTAGLAVVALVVAASFTMRLIGRRRSGAVNTSTGMLARVYDQLSKLAAALTSLTAGQYALACLMAALQCLVDAASLAAFAAALSLPVHLLDALWINGLVYLITLLPVSVAGVGTRDVAVITATATLGVASGDALTLSLLMLSALVLNGFLGGILQAQSRRDAIPDAPHAG